MGVWLLVLYLRVGGPILAHPVSCSYHIIISDHDHDHMRATAAAAAALPLCLFLSFFSSCVLACLLVWSWLRPFYDLLIAVDLGQSVPDIHIYIYIYT